MDIIRTAIDEKLGGTRKAAATLGIAPSTVQSWKAASAIPARHIIAVSRKTGIPAHELSPHIFPVPVSA